MKAVKITVGRPIQYTHEEKIAYINKLIRYIKNSEYPTVPDFCHLQGLSKQRLYEWARNKNENVDTREKYPLGEYFQNCIDYMNSVQEQFIEKNAIQGNISPAFAIFKLKQLGWRDTPENVLINSTVIGEDMTRINEKLRWGYCLITVESFRPLPMEKRLAALSQLSDGEKQALYYHWPFFARENQLPPEQWGRDGCYMWIIRAGRGWGKTRTRAQTFIQKIQHEGYRYTYLCAATAAEVRDIQLKGESGILACCPSRFMPEYRPKRKEAALAEWGRNRFLLRFRAGIKSGVQSDLV
jgi:hypothetical protein